MPLSQEIRKYIEKLSRSGKHNEIVIYLKARLEDNTATAQDILEYARDFCWEKGSSRTYAINAETINKLGVAISGLANEEQKRVSIQFYALAAERGSTWGNRNYADCLLYGRFGLEKAPQKALKYAREAVKLAENIPTERHQHKFTLYEALRKNKLFQEANVVLVEYFESQFQKFKSEKNAGEKERIGKNLEEVIKLFNNIIRKFDAAFKKVPTEVHYQDSLLELQPIVNSTTTYDKFLPIRESAYFFKGKCHEKLGENSEAWIAYCFIQDKTLPFYKEAIIARKDLLKNEIKAEENRSILSRMALLGIDDDSEHQASSKEEKSSTLMLPQDIPLPAKFRTHWIAEAEWFHSANRIAIEAEYKKRLTQLEQLITAKKAEIAVLDEILKDSELSDELAQKKKVSETESEKLQALPEELKQKYIKYLPENRKVFRRHATESHFFNPSRSRKISDIARLAEEIIDHRFKTDGDVIKPINLNGKSTRLLISAERLFQETVIALSSNPRLPQLGIPIARKKPWTIDWGYTARSGTTEYGPLEYYQVGNTTMQSEHRTSPKRQRLGDSFLPEHGTYSGDISPFLRRLANNDAEKEKQLAHFMIRYGQNHQPVILEELKAICDNADEDDVNHFNRICFLIMEKEQAQWHSATDENFQLGMSVAQARCLIMIEAGFISFEEAFKNNVLFSIYSHTGIINSPSDVAKSCGYIEDLYMAYLQNRKFQDHMKFLKKHIATEPHRTCVLTREQAHQDMKQVYGGTSDTDDEGYDTDLSM